MSVRSSTARSSRPGGSSARVRQDGRPVEIPEYEPLEFPLTTRAQTDLQALSLGVAPFKSIIRNIQPALEAVTNSATDINERVAQIAEQQRTRRERRARLNYEDDEDELERVRLLQQQTNEVKRKTDELEEHVRHLIDCKAKMDLREIALRETAITAIEQSRAAEREVEGPKPEFSGQTPLLEQRLENDYAEWNDRTKTDKYSTHKAYIAFKQNVHDAQHVGDTIPPLPKSRTWFPDEAGAVEDSEDSDIEMASENMSLKCPLTLKLFEKPVKSKKCPHVFEQSAIEDLISRGDQRLNVTRYHRNGDPADGIVAMRCPQPGCMAVLCIDDLEPDIVTARKVKRLLNSQRQMEEESDTEAAPGTQANRPASIDEDSGDDVDDFEESQMLQVKREHMRGQGRRDDTMDIDDSS